MSEPAPDPRPGPTALSRWRRGLFGRVFLTFFAAVLAFVTLASIVQFATRERHDAGWVEAADAVVEAHKPALLAALAGDGDLEAATRALAGALELRVAVRSLDGAHLAGDPATPPLRPLRPRQRSRLERGAPVMLREKSGEPQLAFPIGDRAVLIADTGDQAARRARNLALGVIGLVGLLGASAWLLARSLTRRLALLEDGAARMARGELGHRVQVDPLGDEIDRLGRAMNDMAYQLGELIRGQRSLLANVSHELKTPIARLRVLAELLAERAESLPEHPASARIRQGAVELEQDLGELATLVQDLLTSGRLELSGPHASPVQRTPIDLAPFLARLGAPFAAEVAVTPPGLSLVGDPLLLDRLITNLLSNARRACPQGHVWATAVGAAEDVTLAVEDEGPGIPPAERARVFEAFYRLDDARARDHGGAGLGLYLCAQIARAHGGTIAAEGRQQAGEARPGARLVVRLPLAGPPAPVL
ncbi:Signal transduction histidine kinase [Nannocystis exedens]|uniref:histidine kinase n=1 Tax=Nannocystis exedens TaxID=54 RepID=A0A1I1WJ69_9BACT|nr:ATP-binding protein [Nannocystis exedens]PCC67764.1 two-component sensor histidine kinase [Nannocystis exedens]SFD95031.1 Signal transduction histidine kinase [Nannocystis exedens]